LSACCSYKCPGAHLPMTEECWISASKLSLQVLVWMGSIWSQCYCFSSCLVFLSLASLFILVSPITVTWVSLTWVISGLTNKILHYVYYIQNPLLSYLKEHAQVKHLDGAVQYVPRLRWKCRLGTNSSIFAQCVRYEEKNV
jgi:hypothetical protein